ncbi:hypothetical protein ACFFOM_17690 [Microlunatus capsulatus]|uniref:Heme exporter protein CcmD n=1 Tax=Microlunatus capsulatus TaxID=99117 RepID=A0ABS4ZCF6_9ACTN|nr:hypothetical protein [Microlunatus capsulatus]MBP2418664.1 hypothetical protein [Microlunatus capsulatus]
MNDLVAWGVIAGMGAYGFAVLGVVRLAERRRTRRAAAPPAATAAATAPGGVAPVREPTAQPAAG